ncbi:hypothetical protein [Thalassotalea euphylliae]|uniref:Esterase n=1 Tax=Thalassotalea euphylliae TaxID=1655234 RepID=A0A3E0U4Y6_9GAMM|nr:hypothetical protein [Thalassotalea euphylliae]REL31613.1 hypothetical protein DXX94_13290 [Thalassotalea euphylliae]
MHTVNKAFPIIPRKAVTFGNYLMLAILCAILGAMSLLSLDVRATEISALNPIEELTISSELVDAPVIYNVTLPASYQTKTDKRYILLFDIHPRSQPMHAGMHDWMSHNGAWPWLETIIVTPKNYNEAFAAIYAEYVEGKSTKLLEYFAQDLLPNIAKNYRLNGFKIYSGFTGNAAVGVGLLLDQPDLFNAYILASPTLNNHPLKLHKKVATQFSKLPNKPRYVALSMSDSSYDKSHLAAFEQVTAQMTLLAPEHTEVSIQRFDGNYYMTQPVLATSYAIEEIFNDVHQALTPDSAIAKQGADAILSHYQFLSAEKYGFEVSALNSLKALAKSKLENEPETAIAILQKATQQYPESAFAHEALAASYFQVKDYKKAVAEQKLAVEHAKDLVPYWQRTYQEKLSKYQQTLNNHTTE